MSKRLIIVLVALLLGAGLLVLVWPPANAPSSKEVEVVAILPLTGNASQIGKWQRNGMELAIEHLKTDRETQLRVAFEDSESQPTDGVSALRNQLLTGNPKVAFVSLSSVSNACLPILDEEQIPSMLLAVSLPGITEKSEWAFRCNIGSDDEAVAMVDYLKTTEIKKVAIAYVNDEFGVGANKVFKDTTASSDITVVASEPYKKDETNLRTLALKLRETDADAIYVIGYVKASVLLIKQLEELGSKSQILGNMALSVPSFLELGGTSLEGAIFTVTEYETSSDDSAVQKFVSDYKDKYGEEPNFFAAFAYDAVMMVGSAVQSGKITSTDIREHLAKLNDFQGVLGDLDVAANRDIDYPTRIVVNRNGVITPISAEKDDVNR